jgi:MFS family permease
VLAVASSGTLLVLATFSAYVVAAQASASALQAGPAAKTWALSAMSIGLAAMLLTAGTLADNVGYRRVLIWSSALLAAGGFVGALAPTMAVLIGARVLQGVGGAGVLAASLGSIGRAIDAGPPRARATGAWGAAVGAGIAIGPLAAAGLAELGGWRLGFWVEGAAAVAVMVSATTLAQPRPPASRTYDLPAALTLAAGTALLTAGFVEARQGWLRLQTAIALGAALLLLATFGAVELARRRPMVDPCLFRDGRFQASIIGALFTGLAVVGLMSFAPVLMQGPLHVSVVGSAGLLAAWSATSMIVAFAVRSLPSRVTTETRLAIGLAIVAAGEAGLTGIHAESSWVRLLPGLVLAGVGSGIANAALGRLAVESVPPDRAGMGSGANNTARYLGGAAGVALVISVASAADQQLVEGWNTAAAMSAALCALGALIVACCRRRPANGGPAAGRSRTLGGSADRRARSAGCARVGPDRWQGSLRSRRPSA